jgi:hypothetical protein
MLFVSCFISVAMVSSFLVDVRQRIKHATDGRHNQRAVSVRAPAWVSIA